MRARGRGQIGRCTAQRLALIGALGTALVACAKVEGGRGGEGIAIRALSAKPDMVSGDDLLVGVEGDARALQGLSVSLNGADVTPKFKVDGDRFVGLIDGLNRGPNTLEVRGKGGATARTSFVNHAITGPVFAGPHEQPFICETEGFELQSGGTLGASTDVTCSVERRVDHVYRLADGKTFKRLPDGNVMPADAATITLPDGRERPYIVRLETGTINRAIYQIAMLHDPRTDPEPDPWTQPAGWNGRLVYTFGGGCTSGWYRQGKTTGGVTDDFMLREGYAIASSSLNVFGNNCNDLLAAETMMMVKERFVEGYGVPRFTMGWGCSGGSYQNHQIADNYPGLLDGIIPGCSFPDVAFGTIPMITDARLLNHYFNDARSARFTDEQKRQVSGFVTLATMPNVAKSAGRIAVSEFCPDVLPAGLRYDAKANPGGTRCDVYDHTVNVYGRDAATGFARRPLDNVGIQYGLRALNDGVITPAQFLDLNERIGGYDADGRIVPARTVADRTALRTAYETGRLTNGGGGLATTPVIDLRAYSDDAPNGDVHVRYHSFTMRERMRKANGRIDNHVMLVTDNRHGLYSTNNPVAREAIRQMDAWLENLARDSSTDPVIDRIARAKPVDLVDACWTRDDEPEKIAEPMVRGQGRCEALYPSAPSPREVAGGPIAADIVKCQLKPIDPADYKVRFTTGEMAGLKRIFGAGVCDWSKPGVEQTKLKGTWLRF